MPQAQWADEHRSHSMPSPATLQAKGYRQLYRHPRYPASILMVRGPWPVRAPEEPTGPVLAVLRLRRALGKLSPVERETLADVLSAFAADLKKGATGSPETRQVTFHGRGPCGP